MTNILGRPVKHRNQTDADRLKRLSKAKSNLLIYHPFFGTIALSMPFYIDDTLNPPTAATNGDEVRFHPQFMDTLDDGELLFLVAHEVCHPMFQHTTRRMTRDPLRWNVAADIVINEILTVDKIGTVIQGACVDSALYAKAEGVTDRVYNLLPPEVNSNSPGAPLPGEGGRGSSIDNMQDCKGDSAEAENNWKIRVAQAGQAAKMAGKLSAAQERLIGEMLEPKVDWREVLRRFVMKCRDDTRSYARPNRRFITQGLVIPSPDGEAMDELVVAVDCSGSIGSKELNEFAAEIYAIQEDSRPKAIHVVYFDSQVCHYDKFERDEEVAIAPHGGGGTAFSPIFRYVEERDITPVACVVLTDLYCNDFGTPTAYPTLWVTTGATEAPWGEVVKMED